MPSILLMSTAGWLRLTALVAANLLIFREASMLFVIPQTAVMLAVLNMCFFRVFVRLRPPDARLLGAMACGLILSAGALGVRPLFLNRLLNIYQEWASVTRPWYLMDFRVIWLAEYVLVVAAGFFLMAMAGRLAGRGFGRPARLVPADGRPIGSAARP